MNNSLIIFDIDGTLINTEHSYLEAIKLTIEYFLKKDIDKQIIHETKMLPGFNNDWLVAYAITNSALTDKPIELFKDTSGATPQIPFSDIKEIFQNLYLGNSLYREIEKTNPKLKVNVGLWEKETLIFPKDKLHALVKKFGHLKIITGRTSAEAKHIIDYFELNEFFDQIISVEDINQEWFIKFPEFIRFGKDKSNPILFYQIKNIKNYQDIYYVGDSISDMELAYYAKSFLSAHGIHFLGCFSDEGRETVKEKSLALSPDKSFYTADQVIEYFGV